MKKFFGVIFALLLMTNSAFAMTFSETMKIGEISFTVSEGTRISGADNNFGDSYGKGVATFGHDITAIKCFYDYDAAPRFGDENFNYPVNVMLDTEIYAIFSDEPIIFYLFVNGGYDLESTNFTLIGKNSDGTFIKYFDLAEFDEDYYSRPAGAYLDKNFTCDGDTIIFYWKQGEEIIGRWIFQWHAGKENFMLKELMR